MTVRYIVGNPEKTEFLYLDNNSLKCRFGCSALNAHFKQNKQGMIEFLQYRDIFMPDLSEEMNSWLNNAKIYKIDVSVTFLEENS